MIRGSTSLCMCFLQFYSIRLFILYRHRINTCFFDCPTVRHEQLLCHGGGTDFVEILIYHTREVLIKWNILSLSRYCYRFSVLFIYHYIIVDVEIWHIYGSLDLLLKTTMCSWMVNQLLHAERVGFKKYLKLKKDVCWIGHKPLEPTDAFRATSWSIVPCGFSEENCVGSADDLGKHSTLIHWLIIQSTKKVDGWTWT